ncbi:MAG TPA: LuxR C-terminal-related transcriptional regulator [Acidothermaceae bacterium]
MLRARVERLAERARITLVTATPALAETTHSAAEDLGLTPREVEVLAQLAKGRTDRQIAEELFISKKTASVHVSNLLRKLDASSRIEAAEIGQRALLV